MSIALSPLTPGATVESAEITDFTIVNADVSASAGIAITKLSQPNVGTYFSVPMAPNNGASSVNTTDLNYYARIVVPWAATITGVAFRVGATGADGNVRCSLYDAAGARVANKTSDVALAASNTFQHVAFDSTYAAQPGAYFANLVFSSGTGTSFKGAPLALTGTAAGPGSNATLTSLTPPTTISVTTVPFMTLY